MSFAWFQNSIDQAVSYNKCFIIYQTAKVIKLKVHVLQLLNV